MAFGLPSGAIAMESSSQALWAREHCVVLTVQMEEVTAIMQCLVARVNLNLDAVSGLVFCRLVICWNSLIVVPNRGHLHPKGHV